jgi:diguanylate cyclase (GGDEF)-like protein
MDINIRKISETGLYPYEVFKILMDYELTRAQRYPNPIALLMISLNLEIAGPDTLTKVIELLAGILNTGLRVSDIPTYHEGTFLVLLPMTDGVGGQAASQRLIDRMKGTGDLVEKIKFTIHIGISSHPGGKELTAETLLSHAEHALEEARKLGPTACALFRAE